MKGHHPEKEHTGPTTSAPAWLLLPGIPLPLKGVGWSWGHTQDPQPSGWELCRGQGRCEDTVGCQGWLLRVLALKGQVPTAPCSAASLAEPP